MLIKISRWLISGLFSGQHDDDQRALCEYGCEVLLYTVISTLGLLLIGVLFHAVAEVGVMIAIFYLCQSNGGGYHANTHLRCFLTMAIGLLVGLTVIQLPNIQLVLCFICITGILILLVIPLCLHTNKQYLQSSSQQLKALSRLTTLAILLAVVVLGFYKEGSVFRSGCIGVMLSAISRAWAAFASKQHRNVQ